MHFILPFLIGSLLSPIIEKTACQGCICNEISIWEAALSNKQHLVWERPPQSSKGYVIPAHGVSLNTGRYLVTPTPKGQVTLFWGGRQINAWLPNKKYSPGGIHVALKISFCWRLLGTPKRDRPMSAGTQVDRASQGTPGQLVSLRGPSSVQTIESSPCF